jgi:hypothetical protein
MHQKQSWLILIQTLPQPLQTWLAQSYLTQTPDTSCILFVDYSTLELIQDFRYISKIYPLVKSLYPDVTSLYFSSSSVKELIKNNKLEVYSVEVNK